jgi:hypothetical protein
LRTSSATTAPPRPFSPGVRRFDGGIDDGGGSHCVMTIYPKLR